MILIPGYIFNAFHFPGQFFTSVACYAVAQIHHRHATTQPL